MAVVHVSHGYLSLEPCAEPALRSLRESLGVTHTSAVLGDPVGKSTFEQLGQQAWQALEERPLDDRVSPASLQRAAREYLCTCRPEVKSVNIKILQ